MKRWLSTFFTHKPLWLEGKTWLLIQRMRFLKEVRLENISPALVLMYLDKSDMVSEIANGFETSLVSAENEDRKQIFIDYYNNNKEAVKTKLKEQCLKNVQFVQDVIAHCYDDIRPAMVEEAVSVLLDGLKREPVLDIYDLDRKLEILELITRDIYNEKKESPIHTLGHVAAHRSVTLDEVRAILDKATKSINLSWDVTKITNDWIKVQSKIMLIVLYIFANSEYSPIIEQRQSWNSYSYNTEFVNFITNIPSKTPEGMISIWDNRNYPTLLTDFYSSSMLNVNMIQYLDNIWNSFIEQPS
jgi:hypothetical protein